MVDKHDQFIANPNPSLPPVRATDNMRFAVLPLRGALYFFTHPRLWCLGLGFLCLAVLLFLVVFGLLLGSAKSQYDLLHNLFESDWSTMAVTFVSILSENLLAFYVIVYVLLLPSVMDRLFRAVFELENVPWNPTLGLSCCASCLTECRRSCCISLLCLLVLVAALPLLLVPVAGPFLWSAAGSFFTAWDILDRYFGHKKVPFAVSWAFAKHYSTRFFLFGFVVLLLSMVPFLQLLLMFTNLVAGALWACEIERTGALQPFSQDQDFLYPDVELSSMAAQEPVDDLEDLPSAPYLDDPTPDYVKLLQKN